MSKLISILLCGTSLLVLSMQFQQQETRADQRKEPVAQVRTEGDDSGHTGVELIDQAKVLASGGFPFTIKKPGSYRLSSNLTATGGADGIHIQASYVTLDLDGFAIIQKTGGNFVLGTGISDTIGFSAITVRNGSMTGWDHNIDLFSCTLCRVQQITINGGNRGISIGSGALVSANVMTGGSGIGAFLGDGIFAGPGSTISGNVVAGGFNGGIRVDANSTVSGNTISQVGINGMTVICPSNLVGNTVLANPVNIYKIGSGCTLFDNNAP
jgi:hypothetical protein